jgi:hypothetical protein
VWAVALNAVSRRCAHHWPGKPRAGAPAAVEPAGVTAVDGTGESALDGSVQVDDGAESEPAAERAAPTARPGNEPPGDAAERDPAAFLRVAGSDESARDGNVPVGDGAEDRDEVDRSSLDDEAGDPDGRDPCAAARVGTRAVATPVAFA